MSRLTPRPLDYTPAELAALRAHFPVSARPVLLAALPGRSWNSVRKQAQALRLRRPTPHDWTPAQVALLRAHYPLGGAKRTAELTGRNASACSDKAYHLGIKYTPASRRPRPAGRTSAPKAPAASPPPRPKERVPPTRKPAREPKAKAAAAPKLATAPKALARPPAPPTARTPNLLAQKATRQRQEVTRREATDWLSDLKRLPGSHPARLAFTIGARRGLAAGKAAYLQALAQPQS